LRWRDRDCFDTLFIMNYGDSLRRRVLDAYDKGIKTRKIALRFSISESGCRRVKQFRDVPRPKVGGGHLKLDAAARYRLAGFVDEQPDATLEQLRARILDELKIVISIGALWNTLRRMKLSLKKSR